jgi:predicted N-acetyltransferase YhbS
MTLISNQIDRWAPPFIGHASEPNIYIGDEKPADVLAREALLDEAFGRLRCAKTAERLREGRLPAKRLAIVMRHADAVIGTLRMWHVEAGGVEALLLGPLAVAKTYRSRGFGRGLMAEALFRAFVAGHGAVLLVGDAPYYEPFGFSRRHTLDLVLPGPVDEARFLGLELNAGALKAAKGLVKATGARDISKSLAQFRQAA